MEYLSKLHDFTNSIDFKSNDLNEIKKFVPIVSEILGVQRLSTYVMNISTENLVLTRARKNQANGKLFKTFAEVNYPEPEFINKHGRANVWRQSRFYCSDKPGTSLFEVRPHNEWITTMDVKINKPKLHLLAVDLNSKYKTTGDAKFNPAEIAFNKFLAQKFVEEIPEDKNYLYLPTAILTNLLINSFDGIVYPSMASKLKGENFALKTEIIDNHAQIVEMRVQESFDHSIDGNFKVKCLYRANAINKNQEINWTEVSCTGHNIDETIYH